VDISVIIPVFRGESTIRTLFEGIHKSLSSYCSFEVIFVNDSGPDNSWEVLKDLKKKYSGEVRIFRLDKNYGQHNATLFGISKAEGDLVVTMDEDLQHDPHCLVPLLNKQKERDYDVVYGRFLDPKHPVFRKIASTILQKSLKLLIPGLEYYSSYRIIKKETAAKITNIKNSYTFIDANIIKATSEIGFLVIDHRCNTTRKTSYNFSTLASHAVQIMLAYTRITTWLILCSFLLLSIVAAGFTRGKTDLWIIGSAVLLFIISIAADRYHKWEIKNNLSPVISIEDY
jgi:polyisoprenyl-phosphate glycosyltransferase